MDELSDMLHRAGRGMSLSSTHVGSMGGIMAIKRGEAIYARRKETIERVFADAKEKHAMRYTHHRGLAAVTRRVKLKFAAMNLKRLANWSWDSSVFNTLLRVFAMFYSNTPVFAA